MKLPPAAKKCIAGLIIGVAKSAGTNLALRKPGVDPASLLDAAQGCLGGSGGGGNKASGNKAKGSSGSGNITTKDGTKVTGYTDHGLDRAIGDGGNRAGTKPEAILDALKNPTKIKEGIDDRGRPFKVYQGTTARVVINPETGEIVSTNPLSRKGVR